MSEEIRPVVGYEDLYSVSRDGKIYSHRVRSTTEQRAYDIDPNNLIELKQTLKTRGYFTVCLYSGKGKVKYKYVHRLIAMAFIPNPQFLPEVNHIDGNKQNNSIENLEWATHKYNAHHAVRIGLVKVVGEQNPSSKLSDKQRREMIKKYKTGKYTYADLGREYGVHRTTAYKAVTFWGKKHG